MFYAANEAGRSRVVVCPARGFAHAPARNRQRRLVREAYRLLKHRVTPGYDLLLQIRPRRRELGRPRRWARYSPHCSAGPACCATARTPAGA